MVVAGGDDGGGYMPQPNAPGGRRLRVRRHNDLHLPLTRLLTHSLTSHTHACARRTGVYGGAHDGPVRQLLLLGEHLLSLGGTRLVVWRLGAYSAPEVGGGRRGAGVGWVGCGGGVAWVVGACRGACRVA